MESCGLSGLRESYSLDFPLEKVCPISAKIQCLRCQSQTPLVPIWGSPKSEGMCGSNPCAQQRPAQQRGSARPRCSVPLLLPHPNISWAESRSCSLPLPVGSGLRGLSAGSSSWNSEWQRGTDLGVPHRLENLLWCPPPADCACKFILQGCNSFLMSMYLLSTYLSAAFKHPESFLMDMLENGVWY